MTALYTSLTVTERLLRVIEFFLPEYGVPAVHDRQLSALTPWDGFQSLSKKIADG